MIKCFVLPFVVAMFAINVPSAYAVERWRLCGRRLSEVLRLTCQSQYWEPLENAREKKSLKLGIPAYNSVPSWVVQGDSTRLTRGVVDECCRTDTGCTMEELRAYCG